ncbi:MAG: oxidoreductase, molybdopterin binding [Bryobacterales bacterium]|nr:oxidoreductase, molybdopterin binding [Bryobacterales bacterium]
MFIQKPADLRYSEVTPKDVYLSRRRLLTGAALGSLLAGTGAALAGTKLSGYSKSPFSTDEKLTPYKDVTNYNNFYEFGTAKEQPAEYAKNFRTSPWQVKIEGLAGKPKVLDLDAIMKLAPLEERIYRHRCVEAWSMVIPWIGFPLNALIKMAEPNAKAKYVAFESYYDPRQMSHGGGIPFPYVEGLRMDEAMHPLTTIAVGLYGETLPNQNGAPLRLVVPWKYGFKGIKSIVKIRFVEKEPPTTWNIAIGREYGFYSNVNPEVDHPRWTQAKERRLGEFYKRDTVKFNGYGDQVASLYSGMDLRKFF